MKVKDLIAELLKIENQESEVNILGNVGHPEDEETDVRFQHLEVWNDGEESITLFVCFDEKTLNEITNQENYLGI